MKHLTWSDDFIIYSIKFKCSISLLRFVNLNSSYFSPRYDLNMRKSRAALLLAFNVYHFMLVSISVFKPKFHPPNDIKTNVSVAVTSMDCFRLPAVKSAPVGKTRLSSDTEK